MSRDRNSSSGSNRHHRARGGGNAADKEQQPEAEDNSMDDHFLVSCRCESAKILSTLLSCLDNISGSSSSVTEEKKARRKASSSTLQPVTVYVTAKSLSFHVYGKAKQIQSSVDMQASMFMDYHIASTKENDGDGATPEDWQAGGQFCVNLSTVLECLQMLGTHHMERTKVAFSYNTTKELFKLEMIDEFSTFTVAAIPGMVPPDSGNDDDDEDEGDNALPLAFRSSPVTARIILKSSTLSTVMSELDYVAGATRATLSLSRATGLRVSVVGHATGNRCTILVPVTGNHVISVELPSARDATTITQHDYPLQVLKDSMRGLGIAEETCITMNKEGMVAIQHIVFDKTLSEDPCYVDCILCSLVNEDSDDDEEDEDEGTTEPYKVPSPRSVAVSTRSLQSQSHNIGSSSKKKSKVTQTEDDEDDDDHDEDNPEEQQGALLFGSVVGGDSNASLSRSRTSSSHHRRRTLRKRNAADDDDSDGSRNMLQDDGHRKNKQPYSDHDDDDDDDDDADSEVRAVSSRTPAASKQRTGGSTNARQEDCPSPELLYGHQHRS
jgi:Repair protein Rad1/Rec1/Rad17